MIRNLLKLINCKGIEKDAKCINLEMFNVCNFYIKNLRLSTIPR